MTLQEMIDVIRAHAGGECLQNNVRSDPRSPWADLTETHKFNFDAFNYRIKPAERKAREFYLCEISHDPNNVNFPIHVREVLPNE